MSQTAKGSVGVDGCKAGWFCIQLDSLNRREIHVCREIAEVWSAFATSRLILIDIPIGLLEGGSQGRRCDIEARKMLRSPRASSVFTPPLRPALAYRTRQEASEHNFQLSGKRIGVQSWGIAPKIAEVDIFLRSAPHARQKIREVHPEILFWALNDRTPMRKKKKLASGAEERRSVLLKHCSATNQIVDEALNKYRRSEVSQDDILDALAAAVTGLNAENALWTLPEQPEFDRFGLPMEMVYWDPAGNKGRRP